MPAPKYLCGLDAAVDVVGGKWKPLLLWALHAEPRRYGELRRELEGISEKMLIQQLRELERDGLVTRTVHAQVPPKVVYSLTPRGMALNQALEPLGDWGEANLTHILAARTTTTWPVRAPSVSWGYGRPGATPPRRPLR